MPSLLTSLFSSSATLLQPYWRPATPFTKSLQKSLFLKKILTPYIFPVFLPPKHGPVFLLHVAPTPTTWPVLIQAFTVKKPIVSSAGFSSNPPVFPQNQFFRSFFTVAHTSRRAQLSLTNYQESSHPMDTVQKTLLAALLGLLIALAVFLAKVRPGKIAHSLSPYHKPTFLIVGANGAGKTCLFQRLRERADPLVEQAAAGGVLNTVSSLEPNVAQIKLPTSCERIAKAYQLIDYPGHMKYTQLLRKLIVEDIGVAQLKGVIYVVDSLNVNLSQEARLAAMARELFALLSITEKLPNGVDFLFAVNKQDLFDSHRVNKVKLLLELLLGKVISDEIHAKGGRGGSGIDNDESDDEEANFRNEESTRDFWRAAVGSNPFSFELLEGMMDFVDGSTRKTGGTQGWENWLDERSVNYGGI